MNFIEIVSLKQIKKKRTSKNIPQKINSAYDLSMWLSDEIGNSSQENLVAFYLDTASHVTAYSKIFTGSINQSVAHPRDIIQRALLTNSTKIILAHNHPSGKTSPSYNDKNFTENVEKALRVLDIKLLDHLIVSDDHNDFYSFRQDGQLDV